MFAVQHHRLIGRGPEGATVTQVPTSNHDAAIRPSLLVFHHTACPSAEAHAAFLRRRGTDRVSAHLLVEADGSVVQFVPFDRRAWHAGASRWRGLDDLNSHAIGIEVVNLGPLTPAVDGSFRPVEGGPAVGPAEVVEAHHRQRCWPWRHWHAYTPPQIATCEALAALLVQTYGLRGVLGHDDIAPGRKADPGPAFPMQRMRAVPMGGPTVTPQPAAGPACAPGGRPGRANRASEA